MSDYFDNPSEEKWKVSRLKPLGIEKIVRRLFCKIGWHEKIKWSESRCAKEFVFGGCFAPWDCPLCNYQSQKFPLVFRKKPIND